MQVMEREYIKQSEAARFKNVTRQRISELVSLGRLSTPIDSKGNPIRGAVYFDEVKSLITGKAGRPKLTDEERAERGLDKFQIGDMVVWNHTPRDGYGFQIRIKAKVVKSAAKRLLVEFEKGDGVKTTAWVQKTSCEELN